MNLIKDNLAWVKEKLTLFPALRDSNERLYYNYLNERGYNIKTDVKTFLKDIESRVIPPIDSIARASRKIQEEFPELRGQNWSKRKEKSSKIKSEIISLK